jgi:hypothetical protein
MRPEASSTIAIGRDAQKLQGSPRGDVSAHGVRYRPPPLVDQHFHAGTGPRLDVKEFVLGFVGLGTVRQAGHVEVPDHGGLVDRHGKAAAGKLDSGQKAAVVGKTRQVETVDSVIPALHLASFIGHSTTVAATTDSEAAAGEKPRSAGGEVPQNSQVRERGTGSPQKTSQDRGGAEDDLMKLNGWSSPQTLHRDGARSAKGHRLRPPS